MKQPLKKVTDCPALVPVNMSSEKRLGREVIIIKGYEGAFKKRMMCMDESFIINIAIFHKKNFMICLNDSV